MNYFSALELIYRKAPFQKKKIQSFLENKDPSFYEQANVFVSDYEKYLEAQGLQFEFAIDAYLAMCKDMIVCQVSFMKTGKYPTENQSQAFFEVYNSREVMFGYMVGLGFSQFLWSSHYEMYEHLKAELQLGKQDISSYLEIGPGHGLFLKYALQNLNANCDFKVIDISETSIDMARSLMELDPHSENKNIEYITGDFLEFHDNKKFDVIVMGEVLEHVDNPNEMLLKIKDLLAPTGKAFISTCINCPMTDHVFHFNTVDEVKEILTSAGLQILSERILPVEDLPMEDIVSRKITINYSAMVFTGAV